MSQKDGFGSGFVVGSIIGGLVGGLLGSLLMNPREKKNSAGKNSPLAEGGQAVEFPTEETIEVARHRLEDKIAQLNLAIDDVRQQLETVNGKPADSE